MHNLYCVCRAADSYNVSAPFAVKIYRSKNEGSCVSRAVKSKDIRSQTLLSDEPLSSEYGQAHPRSLTEDFSYRRQRRENSPELKPLSKLAAGKPKDIDFIARIIAYEIVSQIS